MVKLVKIPCEHDLLSNNCDVWADAVMQCKGASPYCGADGYCHAGGECFVDQDLSREQAIFEVSKLSQELYAQKQKNERMLSLYNSIIQDLEVILQQNIEKGFSERVFAIRYCIAEIKKRI